MVKIDIRKIIFILICINLGAIFIRQVDAKNNIDINTFKTEQELLYELIGDGINVVDFKFIGSNKAVGKFKCKDNYINIDEGIVLTTGIIDMINLNNSKDKISNNNNRVGNLQISKFSGQKTFDAAIIELNFIPTEEYIGLEYVFASEEYEEYINSNVNDTVAILINENDKEYKNSNFTSVNTLNSKSANKNSYIDNKNKNLESYSVLSFDGFSKLIKIRARVKKDEINSIKIILADGGDALIDSGVFILKNSLRVEKTIKQEIKTYVPKLESCKDKDKDGLNDIDDILENAKKIKMKNKAISQVDFIKEVFNNSGFDIYKSITSDRKLKFNISNIEQFFCEEGQKLTLEIDPDSITNLMKWQRGDIIFWGETKKEVGIISDKLNSNGVPFVIYIKKGIVVEEDILFELKNIKTHYRYPKYIVN